MHRNQYTNQTPVPFIKLFMPMKNRKRATHMKNNPVYLAVAHVINHMAVKLGICCVLH